MLGKFLAVDPGEMTGWSVWDGPRLLDGDQTPMWDFSDAVWAVALETQGVQNDGWLPDDIAEVAAAIDGIDHIVCEDWRLYPWELRKGTLDWDECRTARLIGSLYQAARIAGWTWEVQPASIKDRAIAAGAESYFEKPLYERRHTNDSRLHGMYRNAVEAGAQWTDLSSEGFIEVDT